MMLQAARFGPALRSFRSTTPTSACIRVPITPRWRGTTPNVVPGWGTTHESDTAAIERTTNLITVKGDNKSVLVLGSQFFEGRGGRTQRWHGLDIDGAQEDAAKAYSYYRNGSNDESGDLFTWLIQTVTDNVTIEQTCYSGDGTGSGQGGSEADGSDPTVGDHALVVIELNDSAEVFRATGSTNQNIATTGPVDVQATLVSISISMTRVRLPEPRMSQ